MPVGRPRVLDEVKRGEICALISVGCSLEAAARYVGCNPSTIRREAVRNDEFYKRLRNAEVAAEIKPLNALQRAAATHWRAAAWLLERTRPDRFAKFPPHMVRIDDAQQLLEHFLEIVAQELPDTPECNAAYRRVNRAIMENCRELREAAAISRDRKRIREVLQRMKPQPKWPSWTCDEETDDSTSEDGNAPDSNPTGDAKVA